MLSGYVVNLVVFAICVHPLAIDYKIASVLAFLVAVVNNFWWNRHWTFAAKQAHPGKQAVRFFLVSLVAFGFSYVAARVDGRRRGDGQGRGAGDRRDLRDAAVVHRAEALELQGVDVRVAAVGRAHRGLRRAGRRVRRSGRQRRVPPSPHPLRRRRSLTAAPAGTRGAGPVDDEAAGRATG